MALKGTLKDFGFTDIFQLIQQQQKAGILRITDKETEVRILFDNGKIVGAESTGTKQQKEPLGALLVRAGLVKQDKLDAALATQQKTLRKLGDILIADGAISRDDLKRFLALQTRETIQRLFRWKTGEYEFVPQAVKYDADVASPLNPEHVLMDGARMVDEWPQVAKRIGGLESIPAVPKGVAELVVRKENKSGDDDDEEPDDDDDDDDLDAAFDDLEGGGETKPAKPKAQKIKLTAAQTIVFDLIDGKRAVQDIVDRSLLGEFNTCNALAGIIDKGGAAIVGRRKMDIAGRIPVVDRPRGQWLALLTGILISLAVLVISGGAIVVLGMGAGAAVSAHATQPTSSGTAEEALSMHRASRAAKGAEIFFLRNGRWPKDLAELADSGLVAKNDLVDARGRALGYTPPAAGETSPTIRRKSP